MPVQGLPLPIDSFHIEMSEYLQSPSASPEKLAEISHMYKHMHNNRSKATVAGHLSKKSSHVTLLLNIYTNIHSISLWLVLFSMSGWSLMWYVHLIKHLLKTYWMLTQVYNSRCTTTRSENNKNGKPQNISSSFTWKPKKELFWHLHLANLLGCFKYIYRRSI